MKTKILEYIKMEGSYIYYKVENGDNNNNFGDGIRFSEDGKEMCIREDFLEYFDNKSEYYKYLEDTFEDYKEIEQKRFCYKNLF